MLHAHRYVVPPRVSLDFVSSLSSFLTSLILRLILTIVRIIYFTSRKQSVTYCLHALGLHSIGSTIFH